MSTTVQTEITFTRWRDNERRITRPIFRHVADFRAAVDLAQSLLEGLQQGDPAGEYAVLSVTMPGYSGTNCDGARWFETAEETQKRVDPDAMPF